MPQQYIKITRTITEESVILLESESALNDTDIYRLETKIRDAVCDKGLEIVDYAVHIDIDDGAKHSKSFKLYVDNQLLISISP